MDRKPGKKKKRKISIVSSWHYFRLVYRSLLFLTAVVFYIAYRIGMGEGMSVYLARLPVILAVIWVVYVLEMIFRFFPSKLESPE